MNTISRSFFEAVAVVCLLGIRYAPADQVNWDYPLRLLRADGYWTLVAIVALVLWAVRAGANETSVPVVEAVDAGIKRILRKHPTR